MKQYIIPETTVLTVIANNTILAESPTLVLPTLGSPSDVPAGDGGDGV